MNSLKKRQFAIAVALFATMSAFAQTYWRETIDTVSVPGYYMIELSQELAGLGLNTLRIFDANDTEIPYLLRSPAPVTETGPAEEDSIYGRFVQLDPGAFSAGEDEKGNTVIAFPSMTYPCYLSRLELVVAGKGHYSRAVQITGSGRYVLRTFQLTSRDAPVFYFDDLLIDKDVRIVIENEHNLPLTVNGVKLFGLGRYLCAYLDAHMQYRIETSDGRPAYYDIEGFADEIPYTLPVIKTGAIEKVETPEPQRELSFFEKPLFLWGVIVLTGIGLLFICIKMLAALKKKE